jgi:hypothetical protein
MGAGGFHGRVRDGIGCRPPAMATRSSRIFYIRCVCVCWKSERRGDWGGLAAVHGALISSLSGD